MTRGTGWQPAAQRQSALLLRARREWIAAYGEEPGAPITPAGLGLADPRRGGRGRNRLPDGALIR
ncbi:hypothetical protein [Streptomyces sp. AK02-04a]|uniref:hypothetical protein n=1 Tax=Streptomyces sp. AK02-04a TaxID=3028649 RepID=UPI0029B7664B|nr:hypothetical protein [Streptomyces sp. AK02-04a]MDX3763802.1 hypothetical protein [Streptomyces sp. AK02-04a]